MKILKLLNKTYLSILIIFFFSIVNSLSQDEPVDIWNIDKEQIKKNSENKVLNLIKNLEKLISKSNWKYIELIDLFVNHLDILNDLFDINKGVMIMSEDLSIRENRLNLISLIRNYSLLICDFTLLNS